MYKTSSSISKHTMVYSWAPYTLYGARYVMVDYLIKTEQRALMGSYHASWRPFESGVEATVLHCFDKLPALLLITVFHPVIFTPSWGPSKTKVIIWCELSLPHLLHDEYKLVQGYFLQTDWRASLDCGVTPYLHPKHPGTNPKYTETWGDVYVTLSQPFPRPR